MSFKYVLGLLAAVFAIIVLMVMKPSSATRVIDNQYETQTQMNHLVLRVPEDFPKIQEAINAAAEGATVLIGTGLYKENLQIGKSLRLVGMGQAQVQIQGADASKPVIAVVSKVPIQVYFQGFTVGDPSSTAAPPLPPTRAQEFPPTGLFITGPLQAILRQITIAGFLGAGVIAFSLMPGDFDPALVSFQPQTVLEEVQIVRNGGGVLGASVYVSILRSELSGNGMGFTGDFLYMVNSVIRKNQFWGVDLESSHSYGPQHLGRLDDNEISENGVGVILGALEKDAANSWLWLNGNKIIKNQEYGVVVLSQACPMAIPHPTTGLGKESAPIRIYGTGNELRDNARDLCPPDYPWPPGFRK